MSLFSLSRFENLSSGLRERFSRKKDRGIRRSKPRRLVVDPLEKREMLTVSVANLGDTLINQNLSSAQTTINQAWVTDMQWYPDMPSTWAYNSQAVASDHDGDFVVAWARQDPVLDSNGAPIIDPTTGQMKSDYNIYARYFTDEVQRITLPDGVIDTSSPLFGNFQLQYGGNAVQKLTLSSSYEPFVQFQQPIVGAFTLGFDLNYDGSIAPAETTPTINYSELLAPGESTQVEHLANLAKQIQTALQGLGVALADVSVSAVNGHEFLINFGDQSHQEPQPLITIQSTNFTSGFFPTAQVSSVRQPTTILTYDANWNPISIPVSPDDPWQTARAIEQAFQQTSKAYETAPIYFNAPDRLPNNAFGPYYPGPVEMHFATAEVKVTPVTLPDGTLSKTQFDITFVGDSGKKDQPALIVKNVVAPTGGALADGTVTTLKQPGVEFRVNAPEPDDPFTPGPDVMDQINPAVAMDADGDFVITWEGYVSQNANAGSVTDVFARRYSPHNATGVEPLGDAFQVNQFTVDRQGQPSVGMDDDGNFMIAWKNQGQALSYFNGIVAQRFNRDGARVGNELQVNTEITDVKFKPFVAMSHDGVALVLWTESASTGIVVPGGIGISTSGVIYGSNGQVLIPERGYASGGFATAAFDDQNQFLVASEWNSDPEPVAPNSPGVRAILYALGSDPVTGAATVTVVRDEFRPNSASFDPSTTPLWPGSQSYNFAAIDADGDITVAYSGYGPDVSDEIGYFSQAVSAQLSQPANADLLALYSSLILQGIYPPGYIISDVDVDRYIDDTLIATYNLLLANDGIVDANEQAQIGRLAAILNSSANLVRGEADGVMFTQLDAAGGNSFLFSDNVANAQRDGHNNKWIVALDGSTTGGTFSIRLSRGMYVQNEDVAVAIGQTGGNINLQTTLQNLEAALRGALRVGTAWPRNTFEGPVSVRLVSAAEILNRAGTPWDYNNNLSGSQILPTDYVFEVTFQGSAHDDDLMLTLPPNGSQLTSGNNTAEVQLLTFATNAQGYFRFTDGTNTSSDIFFDPTSPLTLDAVRLAIEAQLNAAPFNYAGATVTLLPGGPPYQFQITFGGATAGTNVAQIIGLPGTTDPILLSTIGARTIIQGGATSAPEPRMFVEDYADAGTIQESPSIAMEPDGDFVMVWTQQERGASGLTTDGYASIVRGATTNNNLYYRRFDDASDTAGPLATDFLQKDGTRLAQNAQLLEPVQYLVVTFDEEMMRDLADPSNVTNTANWALLKDGVEVLGGVSQVWFGMNMGADLATFGLDAVALNTNKWQAVLKLDGNGALDGTPALGEGHYTIVARSSLRDEAGNPLGRRGFNVNGSDFSRSFGITLPLGDGGTGGTGSEIRINHADPALPALPDNQYTQSPNSKSVASDANGNYVTVWRSVDKNGSKGIFAKLYNVTWTLDSTGHRTTAGATPVVAINPGTLTPWANNEIQIRLKADLADDVSNPSVARDADGDWVVTWAELAGGDWNVMFQRFDAMGRPLDVAPRMANSVTTGIQDSPDVAVDNDGDFVIAWQSLEDNTALATPGRDNSGYGVYAQRYNPAGVAVGGVNELQVLSFTGRPTGAFALSWNGNTTPTIDFDGNTFTAATAVQDALRAIGAEVTVTAVSSTDLTIEFVGAAGSLDQPPIGVVFLPDGLPAGSATIRTVNEGVGGEFLVNQTIEGNQMHPSVAMSDAGVIVISWTADGQGADSAIQKNIYARQFGSNDFFRPPTQTQNAYTYSATAIQAPYYNMVTTTETDPPNSPNHLVTAGGPYDGVVQIAASGLLGSWNGSGSLLRTGQHILTAAHVVVDAATGLPVQSAQVTFDTASGPLTMTSSQIIVHPGYTAAGLGNDIAIIVLPNLAPFSIPRYDIYRNTDEVGQQMEIVGYGLSGTGNTGQDPVNFPYGTKRRGDNKFDGLGDLLLGLAPPPPGLVPGSTLIYDFDNGLPANDAIGTAFGIRDLGLGPIEASAAQGDSGGPIFINGLIAGVTSFGSDGFIGDFLPGSLSSYGDMAADTRVSFYASWIDSLMVIAPPSSAEFLVNQTETADQQWSSVAMDADGDFVVTWTSYGQDGVGSGGGPGSNGVNGVYARWFAKDYPQTPDVYPPDPLVPPDPTKSSSEFLVNTLAANDQQYSRVSMDADGDFAVAWESFQDKPAPGQGPDVPNSFGIFAQRYARHEIWAADPTPIANGLVGGEIQVNSTLDGDQRYPSIMLNDTGDWVVVWSGLGTMTGQEDSQGAFFQRYAKQMDDAGPRVTDVLDATQVKVDTVPRPQVLSNAVFVNPISQFVVDFSENLNTTGGAVGVHSILNSANWGLTKDGQAVLGGIVSVAFGLNKAHAMGVSNRDSGKYEAVVTFDGNAATAGVQTLSGGSYLLTVRDSVFDLFNNALDGNYDGTAGGTYSLAFQVLPGDSTTPPPTPNPDPTTPETPIGSQTGIPGSEPATASSSSGAYVVVWTETTFDPILLLPQTDVVARRFDRYGKALGNEFVVNSVTAGDQGQPDVAMDQFGNFVVVWSGYGGTTTADIDTSGVWARMYDAFGVAQGAAFRVNQFKTSIQDEPSVSMDLAGNFVVTWTSYGQDGDLDGIIARRYDFLGQPRDLNEFLVNSRHTNRQDSSDVAMANDGSFVVVWASQGQDSSDWGVYGQEFHADGTTDGVEFPVNSFTNDKQQDPHVAMDAAGNFVVVWSSMNQDVMSGGWGVYGKRFFAGGGSSGEFLANVTTLNWQYQPDVAMADDGRFIVTWSPFGQEDPVQKDYGIFARLYNADGSDLVLPNTSAPLKEFRINALTAGDQGDPAVSMDADGDTVLVWVGPGPADPLDPLALPVDTIYGRIFGINGVTSTSTSSGGSGTTSTPFVSTGTVGNPGGTNPNATALTLAGTEGDDRFDFTGGTTPDTWVVVVTTAGGSPKRIPIGPDVAVVVFDGRGGRDRVFINGTAADEKAELWSDHVAFYGNTFTVMANSVERVSLDGKGGADEIAVYDSAGNDRLFHDAARSYATMTGVGYSHTASNFETLTAFSSSGYDTAYLYGSAGNDTFTDTAEYGKLIGPEGSYSAQVKFFEDIRGYGGGGTNDVAQLIDTPGNDRLVARPGYVQLTGRGIYRQANNFTSYTVTANQGGVDTAGLYGSNASDTFTAGPEHAAMTGTGPGTAYSYQVDGFDYVYAYAVAGGTDTAALTDSSSSDVYIATPAYAQLSGRGFSNQAKGFDEVRATSTGGTDQARLYDSTGNDTFAAAKDWTEMVGAKYHNIAINFGNVQGFATAGGYDTAEIHDTAGSDVFTSRPGDALLAGPGFIARATRFDEVRALATPGPAIDRAFFYDTAANDALYSDPTYTRMSGGGYLARADYFDAVHAYSRAGGADTAEIHGSDSSANNVVCDKTSLTLSTGGFSIRADDFASYQAYGGQSGTGTPLDSATVTDADVKTKDETDALVAQGINPNAWLYYFEKVTRKNSSNPSDTIVTNAVDGVFGLYYWQ